MRVRIRAFVFFKKYTLFCIVLFIVICTPIVLLESLPVYEQSIEAEDFLQTILMCPAIGPSKYLNE